MKQWVTTEVYLLEKEPLTLYPVRGRQMGILMDFWWLNEDEVKDEKLVGCNTREVPRRFHQHLDLLPLFC